MLDAVYIDKEHRVFNLTVGDSHDEQVFGGASMVFLAIPCNYHL
jgi:hypothetical protein